MDLSSSTDEEVNLANTFHLSIYLCRSSSVLHRLLMCLERRMPKSTITTTNQHSGKIHSVHERSNALQFHLLQFHVIQ